MITRVYIDNFRCFTNFEMRPERVNLLIGNNGAGKSTFIDVLHRVIGLAVLSESVQDEFPVNTLTRWDSRSTQRIELDVKGNDGMYEYAVELSHDPAHETVTLQRELVKYNTRTVFLFENGMVELQAHRDAARAWRKRAGQVASVPSLTDAKTEVERIDLS